MDKSKCEIGYYWVKLHPIYENDDWTVSYVDESGEWYLHNITNDEYDCSNSIDIIGEKIKEPK